ncbi:type II/IV secretion system protein, partial [Candidatus Latescibacterota bacterium]
PSIIGVLSQRLVRRLCDNCKEKYQLTPDQIEKYFIWDKKTPVSFYREKGCEKCNNTGFSGRIAIHELFLMNNEIRSLVANNVSIIEIEKAALKAGFITMRYDGFKKILRGITTLSEVDRVVTIEDI